MRVVICLEERYCRTPDGSVWTKGPHSYGFWKRYLAVFDQVRVVARVLDVPELTGRLTRVDGPDVECFPVPYYVGPAQFLRRAWAVRRAVRRSLCPTDAVIMRVSSLLAMILEPELYATGRPYGLEVIGDPYDVFAPGVVEHPLRPFFRWWFARSLRRQCARAAGTSYVTRRILQERYPARSPLPGTSDVELDDGAFVRHRQTLIESYSSVELTPPDILAAARSAVSTYRWGALRVVTVGSLEQPYKGVDVLLRAVAQCCSAGLLVRLTVVGDGRYRASLERLATALGVSNSVSWTGQLGSMQEVRSVLDNAHLFVLASRTEGLPRAVLEAMARALPCIGTRIGGIPELLDDDDLVDPNDVNGLAFKIRQVAFDPARMSEMSRRNLATSRGYRAEILSARRERFFKHIRAVTEAWIKRASKQSLRSEPR